MKTLYWLWISISNTDMLDKSSLALIHLQSAGCTHNDLKKLFPDTENFDPISTWESLLSGKNWLPITVERQEKIQKKAQSIERWKSEKWLSEKSVDIVHVYDPRYPEILRNIGHAPFFFFVRGNFLPEKKLIGVVGSRKNTPYAKRILEKLIPDLVNSWLGIISGGALGVDTLGHEIALKQNGYTVVILGTGIDRAYPGTNKALFEEIIQKGGAVISHFPLGMWPEVYNFPIRNEIVAWLSKGIIIPEAALSSGTLITAQLALEHGRDVFAIPGDIDRVTSEWTNMLIASGQAKCTRCVWDILEEYFDLSGIGEGMTPIIREIPKFEDEKEKAIYQSIIDGYKTTDEISKNTEYIMTDVLITLSMLEINGYINLDEMGKYQIQ